VKEALQQCESGSAVLDVAVDASEEQLLDAVMAVTAVEALLRHPDGRSLAAEDERFSVLLSALRGSLTEAQAVDALQALASLGIDARDAGLTQHLVNAWLRRAHSSVGGPTPPLLRALAALRALHVRLAHVDDAARVASLASRCLEGEYPDGNVAPLLDCCLAVGVPWTLLAPAARAPLLRCSSVKPSVAARLLRAALADEEDDAALLEALRARAGPRLDPLVDEAHAVAHATLPSLAAGAFKRGGVAVWLRRRHFRGVACRATAGDGPVAPAQVEDWGATGRAFGVPALGGALFGFDIGISGDALVSLTGAATSDTVWGPLLTPLQSGAVVSASLAAAVAASALALTFGDRAGRRAELLAAGTLFAAGASLMALAPDYVTLLAGRLSYGAGIGFAMHAAPIFIAETAPSSVRGTLISAKEALIVSGILAGYLWGAAFIGEAGGWRAMLGVSGVPAVAMVLGALTLTESPRWMLSRGDATPQEVAAALRQLRGSLASQDSLDAELAAMTAAQAQQQQGGGSVAALLAPRNARALYVGVSLMLFQQITGQPTVLYYATDIFRAAGFASVEEASQTAAVLGAFKLAMTVVAAATVDRVGRRPLLLGGVSALTASLVCLAVLASQHSDDSASAFASLACLLCYVGAYQVSFGPISWLMVGEVFPAQVRCVFLRAPPGFPTSPVS
jgi:sugar porter (SP) family MFS transporter